MAQLFDASTITRFSQEGEDHFNHDRPCILKRISVNTTSGIPLIQLPDDINMVQFIESGKRGGVAFIGSRKLIPSSRPQNRSEIVYIDANVSS